jgi:hypothetical protein
MKIVCPYEEKIAELLRENGQAAESVAEALKHAENCPRCGDVVLVVKALQQGKAAAMQSARAVSSGYLWWKAQLLQKDNALEQIAKPALWVEKFSLIAVICAVIVFGLRQWGQIAAFLKRAFETVGIPQLQLADLFATVKNGNYVLWIALPVGLAAIAILGGLMLWFSEERS